MVFNWQMLKQSCQKVQSPTIVKPVVSRTLPIVFVITCCGGNLRLGSMLTLYCSGRSIPCPYLFGRESTTSICNAVMRLPSESPVLTDRIRLVDASVPVPGWWLPKQKLRQHLMGLIGRQHRGEDLTWGSFGPRAFTYFLERRNLADRALPIETFYPIHWDDYLLFFASPDAISARLTDKTVGVHLWSTSNIRERKYKSPPPNSWLAVMCERYAISTST
jgi:hypothetical protein